MSSPGLSVSTNLCVCVCNVPYFTDKRALRHTGRLSISPRIAQLVSGRADSLSPADDVVCAVTCCGTFRSQLSSLGLHFPICRLQQVGRVMSPSLLSSAILLFFDSVRWFLGHCFMEIIKMSLPQRAIFLCPNRVSISGACLCKYLS